MSVIVHPDNFTVIEVLGEGRYLGTPVLVVREDDDGFVVVLWPDSLKPGRAHGKQKPFTFANGEWWRLWPTQIEETPIDYDVPLFPLTLKQKPNPNGAE